MHPDRRQQPEDRKPPVYCQTCEDSRDGWALAWLWGILVGIIWATLFWALIA